jgi:hypothetical protein
MDTRSQTELLLIGHPISDIPDQQLLTQKQVLQLFSHYHKAKTIHESADLGAEKVLNFWYRAKLPTKQRYHVVAHVENCITKPVN